MARGSTVYLSYTALVLLSRATGSSAGLWTVDIDNSPAPPAESGPAFSAHASRNRDLLPFQIIGILGAYVGSVLILGTLLLTVGRRLRYQALNMPEKPVELVKPAHKNFDPSPMSPSGSTRGWLGRRKGGGSVKSPSMISVDEDVVEAHKRRQQEELANIYGAVMEHDEARSPIEEPYSPGGPYAGAPPAYPRRERPVLPALQRVQSSEMPPRSPQSPRSPGSPYYSVPPPKNLHLLAQLSPTYKPPPGAFEQSEQPRVSSSGSTQRSPAKLKKSLKHHLGKLDLSARHQDNDDEARTPLSPRIYTNPGPPPEPPSARTMESYPYSPTTPGTARSYAFPEEDERFDQVRGLPSPHPQRRRGLTNESQPPLTPASPGLPASPAQSRVGSPPRGNGSAGDISRPLAFRQLAEQHKQAAISSQQLSPGGPPAGWSSVGSPRLQTTELYTQDRQLLAIGSAALHSPRIYTPYMPIAPPTPVTPHLTTRAERRQREKEEKTIRGAITEEEQVKDESDMWDDAYR